MHFRKLFEEHIQDKLERMGFDLEKCDIKGETVSYNGNVNLSNKGLTVIPISFVVINGNFNVSGNALRNLTNAPSEVNGNFDISHNYIIDLSDGPSNVTGNYNAEYNKLDDIKKEDIQKHTKVGGIIRV